MKRIKKRSFYRYEIKDGVSLSAILTPEQSRCGIYVCEFSDGSEYVGKSRYVTTRIAAHRRRWPGQILAVRISPAPLHDLDQVEQDTVAQEVAVGKALRNKDLVSMPLRSEALDAIIEKREQSGWLRDDGDYVIPSGRADLARQRRNNSTVPNRLAAHADHADVVQVLAYYVGVCLPRPDMTEQRFWSVSNMPSTGRGKTWRRLAAVSVNNVEALVIGEYREHTEDPWIPAGFVNTALATRVPCWAKDLCKIRHYRSTGDVKSFGFAEDFWQVIDLLADDDIYDGARDLAYGLCRKGSGMMARFHDFELADEIFIQIDDWIKAYEDESESS